MRTRMLLGYLASGFEASMISVKYYNLRQSSASRMTDGSRAGTRTRIHRLEGERPDPFGRRGYVGGCPVVENARSRKAQGRKRLFHIGNFVE